MSMEELIITKNGEKGDVFKQEESGFNRNKERPRKVDLS